MVYVGSPWSRTTRRGCDVLLERLLGRMLIIARTDGMRPGIFAGDVVVVRVPRLGNARYAIGDIVAFRDQIGSQVVVQRIGAIVDDPRAGLEYLAHDDVITGETRSSVRPSQIVGRVEARLANLGRICRMARVSRSRMALSRTAPAPNPRRQVVQRRVRQ